MALEGRRSDLLHNLNEVIAFRGLQRRELSEGLQLLQPQLLTYRQHVPVVDIRSTRGCKCTADGQHRLLRFSYGLLEGIAPDVLDLSPTVLLRTRKRGGSARAFHREVDLPVLVTHRRRRRSGVVQESVAGGRRRLAGQVVELIDP